MNTYKSEVVRVATSNNFNCTCSEWDHLDVFALNHPGKTFFVNCNIKTPSLSTVAKHPYKVVVTANPELKLPYTLDIILEKLQKIKDHISFVRVKYIPTNSDIDLLMNALLREGYPVVVTNMRFNGKKSLAKYSNPEYYKWEHNRFRLHGPMLKQLNYVVKSLHAEGHQVFICDKSGKGCGGCGLCSRLVAGRRLKLTSLNLSSSGVCPYNCPDCYAKTMQKFSTSMGNAAMIYDTIRQNDKQAGRTKHIKDHTK